MSGIDGIISMCHWCKEIKEVVQDKIKSKRGWFCEDCLDGYSVYVDEQIALKKDEKLERE